MTRQGKIRYRKNQRNSQETKDGDTLNSVPVKHSENTENNEEIRGRHPTETTYGLCCTPMHFPKHMRSAPIDPDKLAEDIFRKFTLKVLTDPKQNVGTLHTKNLSSTAWLQ